MLVPRSRLQTFKVTCIQTQSSEYTVLHNYFLSLIISIDYDFQPYAEASNLLLETPTSLYAHAFNYGIFRNPAPSADEFTEESIKIDPKFLDKPVWCRLFPKGDGIDYSGPRTADSFAEKFRSVGNKTGLRSKCPASVSVYLLISQPISPLDSLCTA